ncbi:hypothetical protein SAMN04488241_106173 [Sphingomonas rubra]|uniref:Uncharacterized protein n=2 Tax=Sphingomonas rubra TaxID=634430 RepID=A0A1I5SVD0_9SPHN|nr:hypothetical protein SAMN04488241_106173 [Sphingomonas rubra]
MPDVQPTPDLADVPMKPAPSPDEVTREEDPTGTDPENPPATDVTLPTE